MEKKLIALVFIALVGLGGVYVLGFTILYQRISALQSNVEKLLGAQYTPFVCLYPCLYPYGYYKNQTPAYKDDFVADLQTAYNMGFKGIRLTTEMYLYDDGNLAWALDEIGKKDLKAMITFFWFDRSYKRPYPEKAWSKDGFPNNETQTSLYCEYLTNVTKTVKDKDSMWAYNIIYPFNSSTPEEQTEWLSRIQTSEYKTEMQRMIDSIRNYDTSHWIYVSLGLWATNPFPLYDKVPYDLDGISGLGFHHYTTKCNDIDSRMLDSLFEYFDKKGFGLGNRQKFIFVDEWGIQTNESAEVPIQATNESNKARMIQEYIDYFYDKPIVWCYFGLHDYPPENADFGLIKHPDNDLKLSGLTMKERLHRDLQRDCPLHIHHIS